MIPKAHSIIKVHILRYILLATLLPLSLACNKVEGETKERLKQVKEIATKAKTFPVKVIVAKKGEIDEEIRLTGTVVPNKEVKLSSKASGTVEKVFFEKGDPVNKGQILAKIEDLELRLSLQKAEASLRLAKAQLKKLQELFRPQEREIRKAALQKAMANLERTEADWKRMKRLLENRMISQKEYESVKMQYKVAKAEVKSAKENLDLCLLGARDEDKEMAQARVQEAKVQVDIIKKTIADTIIISPMKGMVALKSVEEGERVSVGQPIGMILEIEKVKVNVGISEVDIPKIRKGMEVHVSLDAIPGREFQGEITNIGLKANIKDRTFPIEVTIDNPEGLFRPGMVARVRIRVKTHSGRIIIPYDAIVLQSDTEGVFIIKEGHARFHPVQKGYRKDQQVVILRGLQEGDKVVVVGQEYISEGDQVIIK